MKNYLSIVLMFLFFTLPTFAEELYEITGYKFTGHQKTQESWIHEFLQLYAPASLSKSDCEKLTNKLMTTGVFTSVDFELNDDPEHDGAHTLTFKMKEKWTTIPVIRGAMGGGTPLRVFGFYDTHALGKLWTFGAETRKYGDAKNGVIVWARAPRWIDGLHYVSTEYWNVPRIRSVLNSDSEIVGELSTDDKQFILEYQQPFATMENLTTRGAWKYGLQMGIKRSKAEVLRLDKPLDREIRWNISDEETSEWHVQPKVAYDNILREHLAMDGLKFYAGAGFLREDKKFLHKSAAEFFYYLTMTQELSFASHFYIASTGSRRPSNLLYFGGLDSIRGYLDGEIFGNQGGYANFELRHHVYRGKYAEVQTIAFYDIGSAEFSAEEVTKAKKSSYGIGFRLGSPHIYRLVLRVDYAWSVESNSQGLSIGLNQFFQPYKPL